MKIEKIGLFVLGMTLVVNAKAQEKDAKSNKDIDKKEKAKINAEEVFAKADIDKNGNLTFNEFSIKNGSDEKAQKQFAKMDANRDELVSKVEFHDFHNSNGKGKNMTYEEEFAKKDFNKDGLLTADELVKISGDKEKVHAKIAEMDSDNNEMISKDEFISFKRSKEIQKQMPKPTLEETFKALDKNQNGTLAWEEFLTEENDKASAQNKFNEVDLNKDGRIPFSEFKQFKDEKEAKRNQRLLKPDSYFAEMDADKSNGIDLQEYIKFAQKESKMVLDEAGTEKQMLSESKKFEKKDKDGDGLISKEELAAWAKKQLEKDAKRKEDDKIARRRAQEAKEAKENAKPTIGTQR